MNNFKIIGLAAGLFSVSLAHADWSVDSKKSQRHASSAISSADLSRYDKHQAILGLEKQFKNNGSLMSFERYALQAKRDRVSKAIRNFKRNDRPVYKLDKRRTYALQSDQIFQNVSDNPSVYLGK